MTTIDIFVPGDRGRRRKQRSAVVLIAITGSVILLARKPAEVPPKDEPVTITLPSKPPSTLTHDVLTPSVPEPTTTRFRPPGRVTPQRGGEDAAAPLKPQPQPQPAVMQEPPLALIVKPRALHFTRPGWQAVQITNPNDMAIRIDHIAIAGANTRGYTLDAKECIGISLQPQETCRVTVMAMPPAIAAREKISIAVDATRVK